VPDLHSLPNRPLSSEEAHQLTKAADIELVVEMGQTAERCDGLLVLFEDGRLFQFLFQDRDRGWSAEKHLDDCSESELEEIATELSKETGASLSEQLNDASHRLR